MSSQFLPATARRFTNAYIVDVTPELAQQWLDLAGFNRSIDYAVVALYVRQIKEGLWRRTHQGVAITKSSILIDGQHRLVAVVKAGITVPMIVFVDEPEENFEFIDCGRNRSQVDMLRLSKRNQALSTIHTSTLKAFLEGRFCNKITWSNAELNREYNRHEVAINFIVDLFQGERDTSINDPTVRGFLARAYYSVEPAQIAAFVQKLRQDRDDALIRNFVHCLHVWNDRKKTTRYEIYRRGVQTLLAFLQGRNDPSRIDVSYDVFPVPNDKS